MNNYTEVHSDTNNQPTKYHIAGYFVLLLVFGINLMLQTSFIIFLTGNIIVIFGCAILLNLIHI